MLRKDIQNDLFNLDESKKEYSVSEISKRIKDLIEQNISVVQIRGEISGLKKAASGHVYFTLKDNYATLMCMCWKQVAETININLEDGLEIVVTGKITSYAPQSRYQLHVEKIVSGGGVGHLMQLLQQRKEKLQKEGLFDEEHKKSLPYIPSVIGVVTSITGSVIKDIIHRISDRFPSRVIIWPVAVQGDSSASEVVEAINGFNNQLDSLRPDVIIVARGGGSIEDLWPFNEENVVRAVFKSSIPIISAIGHETDFTLIDFVSDVRAPTPTAAAEFAVPVLKDIKTNINNNFTILLNRFINFIKHKSEILNLQSLDLVKFITLKEQQLDELSMKLNSIVPNFFEIKRLSFQQHKISANHLLNFIKSKQDRIDSLFEKLSHLVSQLHYNQESKLKLYSTTLSNLDINSTLKRGYALIKKNNNVVTSASSTKSNDNISVNFYDGIVKVVVK